MYLLYCDETNLEERSGDFFTYAGLAFDGAKAKSLSRKIDLIRSAANVPRGFKLKFKPAPPGFTHAQFIELKQKIIEAVVEHEVKLLVSVILHDIAHDPDKARRNAINTICFHFDCLLHRYTDTGLVLIDRFDDGQIDAHLAEKFSVGVTGLPFSEEYRLENVVGFHYSAVGQSHFPSLIDILIGSLRFSINAFTRDQKSYLETAKRLLQLVEPLFLRDNIGGPVSEISFFYSPKAIKVPKYREQYSALKKFLAENRVDTAQEIQSG